MTTDRRISEALYASLKQDPFYRTLEAQIPDPRTAREAMLDYYDLSMAEGATWGRLGRPAEGSYGISIWSLPLPKEQADAKAAAKQIALARALGLHCSDIFNRIEASMAVHEETLDLDGYWYLSILGVDPAEQGKGLGGSLVTPVLSEADQLGRHSYLTTFSPRNIPFYERLGYRIAGEFPEPVTQSCFWVLTRSPDQTVTAE